eukprot:1157902-Pelagomonas_calceolata.AAC.14
MPALPFWDTPGSCLRAAAAGAAGAAEGVVGEVRACTCTTRAEVGRASRSSATSPAAKSAAHARHSRAASACVARGQKLGVQAGLFVCVLVVVPSCGRDGMKVGLRATHIGRVAVRVDRKSGKLDNKGTYIHTEIGKRDAQFYFVHNIVNAKHPPRAPPQAHARTTGWGRLQHSCRCPAPCPPCLRSEDGQARFLLLLLLRWSGGVGRPRARQLQQAAARRPGAPAHAGMVGLLTKSFGILGAWNNGSRAMQGFSERRCVMQADTNPS